VEGIRAKSWSERGEVEVHRAEIADK